MDENIKKFNEQGKRYELRKATKFQELQRAQETAPTAGQLSEKTRERSETLKSLLQLRIPPQEIAKRLHTMPDPGGFIQFDSVPQLIDVFRSHTNLPDEDIRSLAQGVNERVSILNQLRFSDGRAVPGAIAVRFVHVMEEKYSLDFHVVPGFYNDINESEQARVTELFYRELKKRSISPDYQTASISPE